MNSSDTYFPEPRPRDFSARLRRGAARPLSKRGVHRHFGRRSLVLLAAVAVPALAAPEEWRSFEIGDAGRAELVVEPMPFEKPGDSFPGSAFYYLAADEKLSAAPSALPDQPLDPGAHWDNQAISDPATGPSARALRVDNSGVDRSRALQCLTAAVYYEAASEPDDGQRAVAQVVLNRVAHSAFPNTVCGVVYQGSERSTGCQFSFTCDGSLARVPNRMFWMRAENVARAALAGYVYAPAGLATHYHTFAVHPVWDAKMFNIANIGAHRFFRMPGPAGQTGAFRFAYDGGEPMAAPHPHNAAADAVSDAAVLDPLALERAYEAGLRTAQGGVQGAMQGAVPARAVAPAMAGLAPVRAMATPIYAPELQARGGEKLYQGDRLPEGNAVRAEYQNSGRWIVQPGK